MHLGLVYQLICVSVRVSRLYKVKSRNLQSAVVIDYLSQCMYDRVQEHGNVFMVTHLSK